MHDKMMITDPTAIFFSFLFVNSTVLIFGS